MAEVEAQKQVSFLASLAIRSHSCILVDNSLGRESRKTLCNMVTLVITTDGAKVVFADANWCEYTTAPSKYDQDAIPIPNDAKFKSLM